MKRIIIYFMLFQFATIFAGCEKEIMSYNGREGVYFAVRHGGTYLENLWPYQPYSNVDFVSLAADEVEFPVKVMITGPVKDYDRTFNVEVNPDSTTAILNQHYKPIKNEWVVPAGQTTVMVKVTLYRTADLEETPVTLGLRLVATPQLSLAFPEWDAIPAYNAGTVVEEYDASLHTLRINDIMVKPAIWSGSIQPGNVESGLFGMFSRKKMEFLSENLGLKYEDFASSDVMPMARMLLVASDAAAILKQRHADKNPVLDDDGRLMYIGSVPWTSIIGVPYVP